VATPQTKSGGNRVSVVILVAHLLVVRALS
jgi:hypothetical protein